MPSDTEAEALTQAPAKRSPPPPNSPSEDGETRSDDGQEEGTASKVQDAAQAPSKDRDSATDAPPLPNEPVPGVSAPGDGTIGAPPLPTEAPPQEADDGWSAEWDATHQAWYFYNRFTGLSQWDNPRVPSEPTAQAAAAPSSSSPSAAAPGISAPTSVAGGYNPAIHGSWDPNAPYAQAYKAGSGDDEYEADLAAYNAEMMALEANGGGDEGYAQQAAFNARTGRYQTADQNPERHSDAAKSHRQMNAYFDVDRAANSHDGRSLKAERRGKQPTKKELSMWKEKRKAKKEEKRRAWLRD